MEFGIDSLIIK